MINWKYFYALISLVLCFLCVCFIGLFWTLTVQVSTDLHAVEVFWVLHYDTVSQDQQTAHVACLAGVVRGERGGGVAHWSQQSNGAGRRKQEQVVGRGTAHHIGERKGG